LTSLLFSYALYVIIFVTCYTTSLILYTRLKFSDSPEFAYSGIEVFQSVDHIFGEDHMHYKELTE